MIQKTRAPILQVYVIYTIFGNMSTLWKCAFHGHAAGVSVFIQCGGDIEAKCHSLTPLRAAVYIGKKVGAVQCLLDCGAQLNFHHPFRISDRDFLEGICSSDPKIFKVVFSALIKSGDTYTMNKACRQTAKTGKNHNLKAILQSGAVDINHSNSKTIVIAAIRGLRVTVQLLLKYGSLVPNRAIVSTHDHIILGMLRCGPREKVDTVTFSSKKKEYTNETITSHTVRFIPGILE